MAELSVVMGVYNGAAEIERTIDSVLDQRDVDLELVVVDDGSSDETPGILARYAKEDSRVRVIEQVNAGLTRALVAGCAAATAPFIARQDCGDVSVPGRFSRQLALIRSDARIGLVSCWTCFEGPNHEPLTVETGGMRTTEVVDPLETFGPEGVTLGPSCHPSALFSRECYERAGGYRPSFRYGQDWDLWYRMAETSRFALVPEVLYVARLTLRGISLTRKREQSAFSQLSREAACLRRLGRSDEEVIARAEALSSRIVAARREPDFAAANYFVGEALRRRGDARAAPYFVQSWRASPWKPKPLLRLIQWWLQRATGRSDKSLQRTEV